MGKLDDLLAASAAGPGAPDAAPAAGAPGVSKLDELLAASASSGGAPSARADLAPPATPERSLLDRAGDTLAGIGRTVAGGAKALGETALHPIDTLNDPARMSQLFRGLDDMTTLGYGSKLADAIHRKIGWEGLAPTSAEEREERAPEFRQLGNLAGLALPGATEIAGAGGAKLAGAAGAGLARALPAVAAPTTALGRAALAGGKAVAGYEATAPALAALSADAEGHRLEAAKEAATNPVGVGLPLVAGAAHALAPEDVLARVKSSARERATKDIAKDIVSAEGPKAKATDQARVKDVSDRLFDLTVEHPELRKVWRESARKALPDIAEAKRVAAKPLDGKYAAVDELTGGGISLGQVVDGFDAAATEAGKTAAGQPQAERIRKVRDNFVKAYGKPGFDPTVEIDGVPAGMAIQQLEKARASGIVGLEPQIEQVRALASRGIDRNAKIPTAQFRQEVTSLHKTADLAPGQIEGAMRQEALTHIYDVGKSIIDKHLDESGLPPDDLAAIRKANDEYFLLSRAEAAIESRGIKEENRPHGFAHTARQAIHYGTPAAVMTAAALHPHAIPELVAGYGLLHAAPAIASRVNWGLANLPERLPNVAPPSMAKVLQAARERPTMPPEADGAALAAALHAAGADRPQSP